MSPREPSFVARSSRLVEPTISQCQRAVSQWFLLRGESLRLTRKPLVRDRRWTKAAARDERRPDSSPTNLGILTIRQQARAQCRNTGGLTWWSHDTSSISQKASSHGNDSGSRTATTDGIPELMKDGMQ